MEIRFLTPAPAWMFGFFLLKMSRFAGVAALADGACTDTVPGSAQARDKEFAASLGSLALLGITCLCTYPLYLAASRERRRVSLIQTRVKDGTRNPAVVFLYDDPN